MNKPTHQDRVTEQEVFAVQLLNTDESIAEISNFFSSKIPDRARLQGVVFEGVKYPLGSWLTACSSPLCDDAEGPHLAWWTEAEFAEVFEAIDNQPDEADDLSENAHDRSVEGLVDDLYDIIEDYRNRTCISLGAAIGALEFVKLDLFKREMA